MFTPPSHSILSQTEHWRVHHNLHSRVEGYLMIGALDPEGYDFDQLSSESLSEMGLVIKNCVSAIKRVYKPKHVFVSRYGVVPGNLVHFHVIPVYDWMDQRIEDDPRYSFVAELTEETDGLKYDAADYLYYIWRELTERADQSGLVPVDVGTVVKELSLSL